MSNYYEITRIKRDLVRLEERTDENHRNILTMFQDVETTKSNSSKAIGVIKAVEERVDADIALLEERIEALEAGLEQKPVTSNLTINIENFTVSSEKSVETIAKELCRLYQSKE